MLTFRIHRPSGYGMWFRDAEEEPLHLSVVQVLHQLGFRVGLTQRARGRRRKETDRKVPCWYRFGAPASSTQVAKLLGVAASTVEEWLQAAAYNSSSRDALATQEKKLFWQALRNEEGDNLDASIHVRVSKALRDHLVLRARERGIDLPTLIRSWLARVASSEEVYSALTTRAAPMKSRKLKEATLHVRIDRTLLKALQLLSARRGVPVNESVRDWLERASLRWGHPTAGLRTGGSPRVPATTEEDDRRWIEEHGG